MLVEAMRYNKYVKYSRLVNHHHDCFFCTT
uniref:Uncharacterized protein n=1 Tax=Arundo donax TaxID=35708 RepID=A0A0A9BZS3_ARUDO